MCTKICIMIISTLRTAIRSAAKAKAKAKATAAKAAKATPANLTDKIEHMLAEIKAACRAIKHTEHFAWRVVKIESNIIPDTSTASSHTSTKTPLLHGYVNVEWAFS